MVLIQVEYDAYTRQFKLIDRDMARALVDGVTYNGSRRYFGSCLGRRRKRRY